MRMRIFMIVLLSVVVLWGVAGCGGGSDTQSVTGSVLPEMSWPAPVAEAVDGAVPYDEVKRYPPGTALRVWVNRYGFDRVAYPVEFLAAIEEEGLRKIVCRAPTTLQIGHGDSGSPVVTPDNKVIGALAQVFADGETRHFKCVSIDDMLKVGTADRARGRSREGLWVVRGVGKGFLSRMAPAGRRTGPRLENCVIADDAASAVRVPQTPEHLLPGHSVTFDYLRGPATYVAVGTLTYEHFAGKYLALGHELDNTGASAIPFSPAFTLGMIVTPTLATKSAIPMGEPVGSCVRDERNGVLLAWGQLTERTRVRTRVRVPLSEEKVYEHELTRDHGSQREYDLLLAALTMPVEIYLRHQTRASADCSLLLQVDGEAEEQIDFTVEMNDDVLLGYRGLQDLVDDELRRITGYYPGRCFVKAALDVSVYPDAISP